MIIPIKKIFSYFNIEISQNILKSKKQIINWLEQNDNEFYTNIKKNAYELIDMYEPMSQLMLNHLIKKDGLSKDYFDNLKSEGHQYFINVKGDVFLFDKKIESIPLQFYHVGGDFFCNHNQLTSLEYFPEIVDGLIYLENNKKLLKYKYESTDNNILNMSDDDFLKKIEFQFLYKIYLEDKIMKENKQIMDNLSLDERKKNNHSNQARIKKV